MTGLSVSIDVPDLDRAVHFYTRALGCEIMPGRNPKIKIVHCNGVQIYLLLKEDKSVPVPDLESERTYQRHWTPVHLDFASADVDRSVKTILDSGGTVEGTHKSGKFEIAHCADPFGHGFCVIKE